MTTSPNTSACHTGKYRERLVGEPKPRMPCFIDRASLESINSGRHKAKHYMPTIHVITSPGSLKFFVIELVSLLLSEEHRKMDNVNLCPK